MSVWVSSLAKSINKLSALKIARIKKTGFHGDGGGLYLQVTDTGAKSWVLNPILSVSLMSAPSFTRSFTRSHRRQASREAVSVLPHFRARFRR
jgi:hypothetical protein